MLLLLLSIIVLHVAVLVLLFVSTIVSVSARRAAGTGGAPSAHPVLGEVGAGRRVGVGGLRGGDASCAPSKFRIAWLLADKKTQTAQSVLQFLAVCSFSVVLRKAEQIQE